MPITIETRNFAGGIALCNGGKNAGKYLACICHKRFANIHGVTHTKTFYGARAAMRAMRAKQVVIAQYTGDDRRRWADYGESLG